MHESSQKRAAHSPVEIEVSPACGKCAQPGRVLTGLRDIAVFNPRGVVPGLYVLLGFALGGIGAFIWITVAGIAVSVWSQLSPSTRVSDRIDAIGNGVGVGLFVLFMHWFRLRALVCPRCKRAMAYRLGRTVPLDWLERIPPQPVCFSCGYSLVGVSSDARCPECGRAFPHGWLEMTRLGVDDVDVQIVINQDRAR